MILPDRRYQLRRYKRKKTGRIILVILVVLCAAGLVIFFLTRKKARTEGAVAEKSPSKVVSLDMGLERLWEARNYEEVMSLSESQLKENPLDYKALVYGGFAAFYVGNSQMTLEEQIPYLDRAIIDLRKARLNEHNALDAKIVYVLGKTYYHKGKYFMDLAIRYLEESVQKGYLGEDTYKYLGLAYSEMGKYKESVDYFLKAAEGNPQDILLLTIAQGYYKLKEYHSSEEYLLRTLNSTEDVNIIQKARFLLGKIYQERSDYIKAEEQYRQILAVNARSADAHYYLGEIFEVMNDKVKARAEWRKTLEIDPSHYGARLKLYN